MNTPFRSQSSADMQPPTRREFLRRLGMGVVVVVTVPAILGADGESESARPLKAPSKPGDDFNAFLAIGEDGRVTCFTGKIEMGQGPITSLPQMMAEDLDVPIDSIDIVMGDTELCPFDAGTWGSLTTRAFGPMWRAAATEARGVLVELAAEALALPAARLVTRDGFVIDSQDSSRKIGYGQLTKGRRIERRLAVKPDLRRPAEFKIVGKPLLRRDSHAKVTGAAKYAGDLFLPGMLCARILRPPAHGARLLKADLSAARAMEGVVLVEQPDLVAVLHQRPDIAEEALAAVKAEWVPSPSALNDGNIRDHLAGFKLEPRVAHKSGELSRGERLAGRRLDGSYYNPYVAHSAMEPHTALARLEGDKLTIWASTQNPFGVREEAASVLGMPVPQVRVITPFVGGGFGGKAANKQAIEAARLAKLTGRPVQVMWTREEEFFNDTFRPAAVVNIRSGLDDAGNLSLWDYEVRFAGDRGSDLLYDVADHRVSAVGNFMGPAGVHPFPVGAWRAPGCNTNAFARESHISRLAELAGEDPIAFRLRHLKGSPRLHRVLSEAAARWGWTPAVGCSGRGLGVAIGMDAGSVVATIAQVAVDTKTGRITVKRVLCVQEMGLLINPAGAKLQMEGCITMGLGYALTEEIRFKAGVLADMNFDSYELPRFSAVPRMETVILEADNTPPQGGGEPAIIVMGGVLANAVYDACGARLTELPMTPARVLAALAKK